MACLLVPAAVLAHGCARVVVCRYVPVINFELHGIAVDLVFARLAVPTLPQELNLFSDALLEKVAADPKGERGERSCGNCTLTRMCLRLQASRR